MAEAVEEGGSKFVDVGDPDNGQMFRFYEVEFSIACAMDGERDVAGIVQWAKDELGLMPSTKEVREVIATLGQYGFLDQAGAARAAATELAPGVVVGQAKRPAVGADIELGGAGSTSPGQATPMPKGASIDLGAPGAAATAKPPRPPVEDVALGAPGARAAASAKSDVSLDLADHLPVKPADVKEAVRQSKQMQAVEVPKDLMDQVEAPVPPQKAKPVEAKPVEAKPVEKKPVEKPVEAKPVEKKPIEKKPIEKPVVAEKQPTKAPPAPRQGVSPALIILLVLAICGAGGYFAWRYLLRDKGTTTEAPPTTPPPVGSGSQAAAPQPPPPPPQPKAKIEIASGVSRDIVAVFPGTIESVDTTERDVDSSAVLVKLAGAKRLEAQLVAADKEIERKKAAYKTAQDARDKLNPAPPAEGSAQPPKQPTEAQIKAADAAVEKAMKAVEEKQDARVKIEDDLEKLYVRAPFEGKVTIFVKPGQKLEENVVAAKIVPKPAPMATFKMHKNATLERNVVVPVKVGEKMHTCTIADSTIEGTSVVCPEDPGLTEGVEATLMVEQ